MTNLDSTLQTLRDVGVLDQKIIGLEIDDENRLRLTFEGGLQLLLWDNGQDCCEERYMRTDDDLTTFVGAHLLGIEVVDTVKTTENDYEMHETQFLRVLTSKGILVLSNHNVHNGYYGGFDIRADVEAAPMA
jgi:hypothetical protein